MQNVKLISKTDLKSLLDSTAIICNASVTLIEFFIR